MNPPQQPRDPNVLSFMVQLVQQKHGANAQPNFLETESSRLYELFGDKLVGYFEPLLSQEQKVQFDQMVQSGQQQDQLLNFLIGAIPNLEQQILGILMKFKDDYLKGEF